MKKKIRHRYIVFNIETNENITRGDLIRTFRRINNDLWLIFFEDNKGMVRCGHLNKENALRQLSSLNSINGKSVSVRTVITTGTIKKARSYL